MLIWDRNGEPLDYAPPGLCSGGILEGLGALAAAVGSSFAGAGAATAGALGLEGATLGGITAGSLIGTGLEGAAIGALGGGAIDAITGKPILRGVLEGGLTGAATGVLAPELAAATGLGAVASDTLAGAGVGAAGSAATGGNPLTGAVVGGAGGALSGSLAGSGGPSAVSAAAPAGAAVDLTDPVPDFQAAAQGLGAVPTGTPLAAQDAAGLAAQQGLAAGGSNEVALATSSPASGTAAPANDTGGGWDLPASGLSSPAAASSGLGAYFPNAPTAGAGNGIGGLGATPTGSGLPTGFLGSPGGGGNPELGGLSGVANPTGVASAAGNTPSAGWLSSVGNTVGGAWDSVTGALGSPGAKALGVGAAGLGLVKDLLAPSTPKGLNAIAGEAAAANTQGQILQNYLTTGTLPPAVQTSINAATQSGITAIKAKYAQMGVAPGSGGEVQDIANLRQNAVVQGAQLADQLLQQGITETQLSGALYNDLVSVNTKQNEQTGSAIANLASALAGSGQSVKLQTAA